MPLLDFIKNRSQTQQPTPDTSQQQKPETAREMYTRENAQEKVNAKSLEQMPADQKAKLDQTKATLEKATQHIGQNPSAASPAPADSTASPQPMQQKMTGQNQTQEALSPTDATAGKTAQQGREKTQEKAPERRPETLPRTAPSWER